MGKQEDFILFLEKNPKLFGIAKSDMCIKLLKILDKEGLPISEIKKKNFYSKFSEKDLETLLELLSELKILDKHNIGIKTIYYANDNTKMFLEIYEKTKKEFEM
jgi:hypothetical protein